MTTTTTEAATTVTIQGGTFTVTGDGLRLERDGIAEHFDAIDTIALLDALDAHETQLRHAAREQRRTLAWDNAGGVLSVLARQGIPIFSVHPGFFDDTVVIRVDVPADRFRELANRDGVQVEVASRESYDLHTAEVHTAEVQPGVLLTLHEAQ